MSDLSVFEHDGELVVDSRLVAPRLGIDHNSFIKTIEEYQPLMEKAFGVVRFQIEKPRKGSKGGRPQRYALLTENQSMLAMSFSRNTPQVVQAKVELVQKFSKAKELLLQRQKRAEHVPYWYERMRIALSDTEQPLQVGYFCVYREMMDFFCELENRFNYIISDIDRETGKHLVPDVSIGQRFNKFLRCDDEMPTIARRRFLGSGEAVDFRQPGRRKDDWFSGGKDFQEILMYNHVYPESSHGIFQVHPAKSYPDRYRDIFRYYLQEYWIPDFCVPYLTERDPQGLNQIQSRIMQMTPSERIAIGGTLVGALMPSLPLLLESA